MAMTPRQRVEIALRGGMPDRVPFTIYSNKLPRCQAELELRNAGAVLLERSPSFYRVDTPNCTQKSNSWSENGAAHVRTEIETPKGALTTINRPQSYTTWHVKRMFSDPTDYDKLISLVRDRRYSPNYEAWKMARDRYGDGVFLRGSMGYSPLQEIIYGFMGVDRFSMEWADNRDELLKLYDAMNDSVRALYPIIGKSPVLATNYGGNVSPEIIGKERFEKYILPCYNEAADVVHDLGDNLLGVHFDANNLALADGIAESRIDYIEAFTPPPDCDMSVAQARSAWPDKPLWINFPSSVHLSGVEAVTDMTRTILAEAAPGDGFIMGITEDVPDDKWEQTFPAIARVLSEEGALPLPGSKSLTPIGEIHT
jgi:hypothetical protein